MGRGGQLRCIPARNAVTDGPATRRLCHSMGTFTGEVDSLLIDK